MRPYTVFLELPRRLGLPLNQMTRLVEVRAEDSTEAVSRAAHALFADKSTGLAEGGHTSPFYPSDLQVLLVIPGHHNGIEHRPLPGKLNDYVVTLLYPRGLRESEAPEDYKTPVRASNAFEAGWLGQLELSDEVKHGPLKEDWPPESFEVLSVELDTEEEHADA